MDKNLKNETNQMKSELPNIKTIPTCGSNHDQRTKRWQIQHII